MNEPLGRRGVASVLRCRVLRARPRAAWPLLLLTALASACGGRSAAGWADEVPPAPQPDAPPVRLAEGEPPPPFSLETSDGERIDSRQVVGARPLLLLFFTTWCGVCRRTLPEVREVLQILESTPPAGSATAGDDTLTLLVSLDGTDTWPSVEQYLAGYQLDEPVVRGALHEPFVMDYDPTLGIPVAIVVGRDGKVVDIQRGWSAVGARRLRAALELARAAAPAAKGATRRSTSAP